MRILRILSRNQRLGRSFHDTKNRSKVTWETVAAWLEAVYRHKAPATQRKIRETLQELQRLTENPHDVDPSTIADLITRWQQLFNRQTTINSKLRVVRTVLLRIGTRIPECRLAWESGSWWVREEDDWTPTSRKHMTPEEILAILDQADVETVNCDNGLSIDGSPAQSHRGRQPQTQRWYAHRRRALTWLLAACGLRAMEALTARTIDYDGEILHIVSSWKRTKTKASSQPVPVIKEAAQRLNEWLEIRGTSDWLFPSSTDVTKPWTSGGPGYKPIDQIKKLGQRSGVIGVTLQSFRHSWATIAEIWGLSETQIQRILRHTTPLTQRHYRHSERQVLNAIASHITFDRSVLLPKSQPVTYPCHSKGEPTDGTDPRTTQPRTSDCDDGLALDATQQKRGSSPRSTREGGK